MDPQPPTAWIWLWSGGESFLQEDLQPEQEVDMLLLGPDTRVEPDHCASVDGLQEELGDSAVSVG